MGVLAPRRTAVLYLLEPALDVQVVLVATLAPELVWVSVDELVP